MEEIMHAITRFRIQSALIHLATLAPVLLSVAGSTARGAETTGPQTFATPEEAVETLIKAATGDNMEGAVAIFGSEAKDILTSGDPINDRNNREVIRLALKEK